MTLSMESETTDLPNQGLLSYLDFSNFTKISLNFVKISSLKLGSGSIPIMDQIVKLQRNLSVITILNESQLFKYFFFTNFE